MTWNPSRNTLHLANHTKSIDLEHLKNTQYSLATQHQKYSRFRKVTPDHSTIWIEYNCNHIPLSLENPKLDVNLKILESNLSKTKFLKYVSYLFENINKPVIIFKDWSKHLMKERIQLENI